MGRTVVVSTICAVVLAAAGCGSASSDRATDAVPTTAEGSTTTTERSTTTTSSSAASSTTQASSAPAALGGVYVVTAPAPSTYQCTFGAASVDMWVNPEGAVTILDPDGPISGTITGPGPDFTMAAVQPVANQGHTIVFTVTDGGNDFTATDTKESSHGSCSFSFSGQRTSTDLPAG